MKSICRWVIGALSFILLMSVTDIFAPSALANGFDHKTEFTVNQPIRIPGNVVLPAGKYIIKLADPAAAPQLVRIMNAEETRTYATVYGIPENVQKIMDKPVLQFGERAESSVQPLRAWYYPGVDVAIVFPEDPSANHKLTASQPSHVLATAVDSNK